MQVCDRCHKETLVTRMSFFNTDTLCHDCIVKENEHPDYDKARLAERDEIIKGNYNFPGIGLPKDLIGGHVMSSGIKYTQAELIKYPLLTKINDDMTVVAIDCDYTKLEGVISEIRYGTDRETENEGILEIVVDFYLPDEVFEGIEMGTDAEDVAFDNYLTKNYRHLNGTCIDQVIMSEEILVFYFIEEGLFRNIKGEIIDVTKIVLPKYNYTVNWALYGSIEVEAMDIEDAQAKVEHMDSDTLYKYATDEVANGGLEIGTIERGGTE